MKKLNDAARKIKADRLISIACLKKESRILLYYHFSKKSGIEELRAELAPGESVETMILLYANAELFEAEITELYGVKFTGNPSSGKRLFLEEK